ncbi:MAG: ATP-binding protein [Planctomycetes bacterium]|nr:ATP-binding protein [Planctomycetota bacterium]
MQRDGDSTERDAEIERLKAEIETLRLERRSVADANARAAMKLVELVEQRRTESEERERRLRSALEEAETASRQKDLFLAKVSHELRTPLNGVIGMTTLLLDGELSAVQRECAESALISARNLLELIQDILDLSKLTAAQLELDDQEFDVWRVVEEVVRSSGPRAHARGLEIGVTIDPDVPRTIRGDSVRLRQVISNLCANAIKFTNDGEVWVHVRPLVAADSRLWLRVDVVDTGCGIPQASFPKLFRAFSQVDDSMQRRHDGTGLGLAISQGIVALMGGRFDIDSEVGVGSRFSFEWPVEGAEPVLDPTPRGEKIALVVAASSMTERTLDPHLERVGARIVHLADLDALERLLGASSRAPDWVLVELGRSFVRDAAFAERCARIAARTKLAILAPIEAEASNGPTRWTVFTLPLCPSRVRAWLHGEAPPVGEANAISGARAALAERLRDGVRVLLVEDNPVNQRVAKGMLQRLGCRIDVADNGEEAVQLFHRERYSVVLMDCQMPVLDGLAAARRIRAIEERRASPRVPIVALTAQAMAGDRERCLEAGMDDYLAKPFDPLELARILRRWAPADAA